LEWFNRGIGYFWQLPDQLFVRNRLLESNLSLTRRPPGRLPLASNAIRTPATLSQKLYDHKMKSSDHIMRFPTALFISCVISASLAVAQSAPAKDQAPAKEKPATTQPATAQPAKPSTSSPRASRYHATGLPSRARTYYEMLWGVDSFGIKAVESGELIRFSYRVLDPNKASQLNDKHDQPALIDEKAGVKLSVPTLEKVGALRQSSDPEAGKVYWMVFSNKERYVKPGHRVSVVIGKFRVDNLLVE